MNINVSTGAIALVAILAVVALSGCEGGKSLKEHQAEIAAFGQRCVEKGGKVEKERGKIVGKGNKLKCVIDEMPTF